MGGSYSRFKGVQKCENENSFDLISRIVWVGFSVVCAASSCSIFERPLSDNLLLDVVRVSNLLEGEGECGVDSQGEMKRGRLFILRNDQRVPAG